MLLAAVALAVMLPAAARQQPEDPAIREAVERFYATQQAEDLPGYLALWSRTVDRPREDQLKYIFESGDDEFSDLAITKVVPDARGVTVRVSVMRRRTIAGSRRPDGSPMVVNMSLISSLSFVREDGAWTLVREGSATDGLAAALIQAETPAEREQLLAADPDLVGPALLSSMARQADSLSKASRFAPALAAYDRIVEMAQKLGNKRAEADAFQNIGNAQYFLRNLPDALAAFGRRLVIEREVANDEGIAAALLGMATVHYSFFEYSDALNLYREALGLQEKLGDTAGVATTLVSTGNVQYVQGDYAGAITDYRRSRDLCRKATDSRGEARALAGLGRAFAAQGDLAAALDAYAGVLEEGRARRDRIGQGATLLNIGQIHVRLGNFALAWSMFDESRAHFEAMKDMPNVGRVWQATAIENLITARFGPAEAAYTSSGAACTAAKDDECVARSIVGLAFAQASQGKYEPAVASYGKAIAAFTALKQREEAARAEVGLSQALLGLGNGAAALAAAARARDQAVAIARDDVLWRALVAESRAHRGMRNPARALAAARSGVDAVQRMTRAALDRPTEQVSTDTGAAYALLAVLQTEAGDAAAAFATVEARRSHLLRVTLAANERDIRRGMTAEERDDERLAASELVPLLAQIDREKRLPKPDAARLARLQQSADAATTKRRAIRDRLFARLPDLAVWRGLALPAGPDDVGKALAPAAGAVLVELVIDDEDLLAVVASRDGERTTLRAHLTAIPRQTLAERIARALDPSVLRSTEDWRTLSTDLVKAIPPSVWTAMRASSDLVIVPDDVLWRVPFEALPAGDGWLGDRSTVTYAGSVTAMVRAPAIAEAPSTGALLAVGAPALPSSIRDRVAATAPGWTLRTPEVTEAELQHVTEPYTDPPAATLAGASATESALRAQAPAARTVHIAAPFRMNSASPLFSTVLLAGDDTAADRASENDGALEAREVMNLDLRARTVVMSDGAAASMRDGAAAAEAVQWSWRAAGVPSIVLARWPTDGEASAALLGALHEHLHAGDAPAAALQAARAALRAREETRAPYFWAGWIVIGQ